MFRFNDKCVCSECAFQLRILMMTSLADSALSLKWYVSLEAHLKAFCLGNTVFIQAAKMPDDLEGAKPSVVAELVAYFTKPEAYFVTGRFPRSHVYHHLLIPFVRTND